MSIEPRSRSAPAVSCAPVWPAPLMRAHARSRANDRERPIPNRVFEWVMARGITADVSTCQTNCCSRVEYAHAQAPAISAADCRWTAGHSPAPGSTTLRTKPFQTAEGRSDERIRDRSLVQFGMAGRWLVTRLSDGRRTHPPDHERGFRNRHGSVLVQNRRSRQPRDLQISLRLRVAPGRGVPFG